MTTDAPAGGPAALPDPGADAERVVTAWAQAFTASDIDAIVALYAPDATFLGTQSTALVTEPAGVRAYFVTALKDRSRTARILSMRTQALDARTAVVCGLDAVGDIRDGKEQAPAHGRFTFVVARRDDDWRIVHFHRSALPGQPVGAAPPRVT